ncbi:MAG: amidophosphoribosyltransferase [Deltaproteobacteria bacterium]|nr:amidophosphoribosyltransferase [Deltaproteobacteria bacterium]
MCGIFGIYGHLEAAHLTYLGLHALQHRGQESAGIAVGDGTQVRAHRGMGLVVDVFDAPTLKRLNGGSAIGHVRYSTAGDSDLNNAQPLTVRHGRGQLAVAHNGNLTNARLLRQTLEEAGSIFTATSDSEVIVHLFARDRQEQLADRIAAVLPQLRGAFSLVFLTERELVAARDPLGFRPLAMGRLVTPSENGGAPRESWVFASETCAFDLIGAEYVRPVDPGEIVVVDERGPRSLRYAEGPARRFCVFEHVYFARPDSKLGGHSVYLSRHRFGRQLAREQPASADLVISVPDSGTSAALGFAQEAGLPFEMGLIRSHYVGRTFIEPQRAIRNFGVRLKLAPVRALIEGKRLVVVDDSLVRGTTSRKIVTMLRQAGAKEVHLRISSPPIGYPCHYGIDTPTREELIGSSRTPSEIAAYVGADSLGYLSLEGMLAAIGETPGANYCDACFTGRYPSDSEPLLPPARAGSGV